MLGLLFLFAAGPELDYALLTIDGEPVGYETTAEYREQDRVVSEDVMRMQTKRFGQNFSMVTTLRETSTDDGKLETFQLTISNNGQVMQTVRGVRSDDTLAVTQLVGGTNKESSITLGPEVRSISHVNALLKERGPLAKGDSKSFEVFSPETLSVYTLTVTGLGSQPTKDRDDSDVDWVAEKITRSDLPIVTTQFYDGDELAKGDLGMMDLVVWPSDREEAVASLGTGSVDFGLKTVVAVAPIPGLAKLKSAKLRVEGLQAKLPAGITQRIEPIADSDAVQVTLRRIDVRLFPGVGDAAAEALQSSRLIDFDSEAVQGVLENAPERTDAAGQDAAALERYVRGVVSQVSFGYGFGSASDTAKSKSGDCSECAVLLAAVLRAREIPARVSYGLVYADGMSAFVPHMWTEARLQTPKGTDVWVPLDATRAQAGVAPTHLCFGTSLLESEAPLALSELVALANSLSTLSIRRVD